MRLTLVLRFVQICNGKKCYPTLFLDLKNNNIWGRTIPPRNEEHKLLRKPVLLGQEIENYQTKFLRGILALCRFKKLNSKAKMNNGNVKKFAKVTSSSVAILFHLYRQ